MKRLRSMVCAIIHNETAKVSAYVYIGLHESSEETIAAARAECALMHPDWRIDDESITSLYVQDELVRQAYKELELAN